MKTVFVNETVILIGISFNKTHTTLYFISVRVQCLRKKKIQIICTILEKEIVEIMSKFSKLRANSFDVQALSLNFKKYFDIERDSSFDR